MSVRCLFLMSGRPPWSQPDLSDVSLTHLRDESGVDGVDLRVEQLAEVGWHAVRLLKTDAWPLRQQTHARDQVVVVYLGGGGGVAPRIVYLGAGVAPRIVCRIRMYSTPVFCELRYLITLMHRQGNFDTQQHNKYFVNLTL